MKKLLLSAILCTAFALNVYGSQISVIHNELSYKAALTEDDGRTFTFVQTNGDYGIINVGKEYINVDIFDAAENKLVDNKKIKIVDNKFGGYISDGKYHYFLFGNDNINCQNSATVYKLLKYDYTFNKVSTFTLKGDQVYARNIFLGGTNCDMRLEGNYLYINDVVTEYKIENLYYQNNRSFIVDVNKMSYVGGIGGMTLGMNGFDRNEVTENMSAAYDNKYYFVVNSASGVNLFEVDPSDPESKGEHSVKSVSKTGLTSYSPDVLIVKPVKDEETELYGFECTGTSFVAVGTQTDKRNDKEKLYISSLLTEQFDSRPAKTIYIDEGENIDNVTVKKTADDNIVVMWKNGDLAKYCQLDALGNVKNDGKIYNIFGCELPEGDVYVNSSKELMWPVLFSETDFALYKLK